MSENLRGEAHPNWAGGKFEDGGYIWIHLPDGSVIQEHRYVVEQIIGRKLRPDEVVHHIDENKKNNSPSNLMILSRREHAKIHEAGLQKARNPL